MQRVVGIEGARDTTQVRVLGGGLAVQARCQMKEPSIIKTRCSVSQGIRLGREPDGRKSNAKAGTEGEEEPKKAHGWSGTVREAIEKLDYSIVVTMKDDMASSPLTAPTHYCLDDGI